MKAFDLIFELSLYVFAAISFVGGFWNPAHFFIGAVFCIGGILMYKHNRMYRHGK